MTDTYTRVTLLADLNENQLTPVEIDGEPILLALVQGQVHAFDAVCTHGFGYLEDGNLEGHEVVCPLHQGAFDIRDGCPTRAPCTERLKTYPVRIEGADVYLAIKGDN
jgi:naphthalene 1,2-dioxygenase system ferredoxin subunit